MPNILITGAASGLGRAFLHHYINTLFASTDLESRIYAIDHSAAVHDAKLLTSTSTDYDMEGQMMEGTRGISGGGHRGGPSGGVDERLKAWVESYVVTRVVDITSLEAVSEFFETELKGLPLDLVVHSAGIRGLVDSGSSVTAYGDVRGTESLGVMDAETMRRAWEVNVLGAFEVLRRCVPGLRMGAEGAVKRERPVNSMREGRERIGGMPIVIIMGSRMGSIGNNAPENANAGGAYAYRASKAALNAVVKSFSVDVPEVIWTVVHPGRVETGLVRVKEDGAMSVQESVGEMVGLIESLGKGDSGRFVDRFGGNIPW